MMDRPGEQIRGNNVSKDTNLEKHLQGLLRTHGPIKAKDLVTLLTRDFGVGTDKSTVNKALYRLEGSHTAQVNESYEWSLATANGGPSPANSASLRRPKAAPSQPQAGAPMLGLDGEPPPEFQLTEEQKAIVDLSLSGNLLVNGQAGSGKTTVLTARAGRLLSALSGGSILFVTYNSALAAYVRRMFKQQHLQAGITVVTFHEWCRETLKVLTSKTYTWVNSEQRSEALQSILPDMSAKLGPHRLLNLGHVDWWSAEIAWIFGQGMESRDAYIGAERVGRGAEIRLTTSDREVVWQVHGAYMTWLNDQNAIDYDDAGGAVLWALQEAGGAPDSIRFDHVMIDEVQDFDRSWLLPLTRIPKVSMCLAGDLAQKIYRRTFTWASVGIEVRGRSRRLSASHRTTIQIMKVAERLLENNGIRNDEGFTEPVMPIKNGPLVQLLLRSSPKQAYEDGYDFVRQTFSRMRVKTIAVAVPISKQAYPAKKSLEARGLAVRVAQGQNLGSLKPGIVITNFHQIKGLEFDHVVLIGLHDDQFPGRFLKNTSEEDRPNEEHLLARLLYMTMTRAKESLTLVGSRPLCRFLKDTPMHLFTEV